MCLREWFAKSYEAKPSVKSGTRESGEAYNRWHGQGRRKDK